MPLNQDQARSLLQKAKDRNPNLTREQAKSLLNKANSRVDAGETPNQDTSFMQKAGDFLSQAFTSIGTSKLLGALPGLRSETESANQITNSAQQLMDRAQTADPMSAERLRRLAQEQLGSASNIAQTSVQNTATAGGVTPEEMQMGAGEFAARRGAAAGFEIGSFLAPNTTAAKSLAALPGTATAGARVAGAGLAASLPGLFSGAKEAALTADSIKEGGVDVVEGAVVGAATGAAFQTVGEFARYVQDGAKVLPGKARDAAKNIYRDTLKNNVRDQKFYKQAGGADEVIEDAVRLRVPVTKNGVQQELERYGAEYGSLVDDALAQSEKAGQTSDIVGLLKKTQTKVLKELNRPETRSQYNAAKNYFDDALEYYGKSDNTWRAANDARKLLDREVGGQVLDQFDQGQKYAMKKFATEIRTAFKENFPELKDAIRRYQLLSGLSDAFKKEPIFGLPEITSAAAGTAISGGPGGIAGLLGGIAARSPGLKRAAATSLMQNIPDTAVRVTQESLKPATAPAQAVPIMSAIQRAVEKERSAKQERRVLP